MVESSSAVHPGELKNPAHDAEAKAKSDVATFCLTRSAWQPAHL